MDSCCFWPQVTWWVSTREARPCQRVCFLFGGAGICSSCVNPEVVASPVRKHSCDFLACDPVLGPQPLRSSPPQEGPGVTTAPRCPCGGHGGMWLPQAQGQARNGPPGTTSSSFPEEAPLGPENLHPGWLPVHTSRAGSTLRAVWPGRGRTHQLPILQETAPFPIAQSSNSARGSDSRCFWHQEEPSVNPGTWPGQARVPVDPVSTSGQATGPPASWGVSSVEDMQGAGSRQRQSGTSAPSL